MWKYKKIKSHFPCKYRKMKEHRWRQLLEQELVLGEKEQSTTAHNLIAKAHKHNMEQRQPNKEGHTSSFMLPLGSTGWWALYPDLCMVYIT